MNNLNVKYFSKIFCKTGAPSIITNDLVMIQYLKSRKMKVKKKNRRIGLFFLLLLDL